MREKVIFDMLTEMKVCPEVWEAVLAALTAGTRIAGDVQCDRGNEKNDPNVGHHAIVTGADLVSQELILDHLAITKEYPRFITEEKEKATDRHKPLIFRDSDLSILPDFDLIYSVDSLDGTSQYANGLYEWSVSVGVIRRGAHVGGAIFAPAIRDGVLLTGQRGKGALYFEGEQETLACRDQ